MPVFKDEEYSASAHLSWAMFLNSDAPERILMFTAGFFDASGKENDSIALAVGGYAASRGRWELFERYWADELRDFGIRYFRMTEYINRTGEFGARPDRPDRTDEERRQFFDNLTVIIGECAEVALGCVVLLTDYHAVNAEYCLQERFGHPFPLAGFDTIKRLHGWTRAEQRPMPALSVFEDGDEHKGELIDVCRRELPLRPVFQGKGLKPLQAADIAAWDLRNITIKLEQNADPVVWWKSRERLRQVPEGENGRGIYTLDDLLRLCRNAGVPLRT